jgi:4-amino-4-deoxy-L-arabinose transferase-like glycosyltransferase
VSRWRIGLVAALLLASLAIRVIQVETTSYRPRYDAASYLTLAQQIAQRGDYARGPGAAGTRGPTAYFPPGYPFFLAGVHVISPSVRAARLSQALLGTVTVALIGLVALEAVGATAALAALALAAIYPVLIELSAVLVVQNLLTPLLLGAAWSALRARRAPRPDRWLAASGLCLGLAALTHQEALAAAVPLAFAAWQLRRRWTAPVIVLGAAALAIAPWTIRNAAELHSFVPVSDETGITLAGTYNPTSAHDHSLPYKWRIFLTVPADGDLRARAARLTEPELSTALRDRALSYIESHPAAPVQAIAENTLRLFELEGSFAWRASAYAIGITGDVAQIGVASFWLLALLALAGAFTRIARAAPVWLWAIPILLWLAVAAVNAETPRFREPLDPFLIVLAGCALAAALEGLGRAPVRGQRRPAVTRAERELVEMSQRLA